MNDGKKIEKLVRLIHETLKNIPNTKIHSNFKIDNLSGRKREIDILIESKINNMDIKIVIECKDLKIPVPVEKIEAFNSKCERIKGVSKKVFVSSSGYQADSYEAAKDFDIELYSLNDISKEQISKWFPIKQIMANIKLKPPFKIITDGTKEELKHLSNEEPTIYYYENKPPVFLTAFIWNTVVVPKQHEIYNCMLYDFMKGKCRNKKGKLTLIPFSLKVRGIYILGKGNKKLNVLQIDSKITAWYDELPAHIIEAKKYEKIDSNPYANIISIDLGEEEISNIVFTNNDNISFFHTGKDGQTYKLKTLVSFDPKTNKLQKYR